jgi:hypothetical protein
MLWSVDGWRKYNWAFGPFQFMNERRSKGYGTGKKRKQGESAIYGPAF